MMSLCSNSDPKKNSASLVLGVFTMGIVYRIILHDFHEEQAFESMATQALDSSSYDFKGEEGECMESKLFKMWQKEAEVEKAFQLDIENLSGFVENYTFINDDFGKQAQEARKDAQLDSGKERTSLNAVPRGLRGSRTMTAMKDFVAKEEKMAQDAKARQAQFDRLYEEAEKAIHEKRSSPPKWLEIQAELQKQYDNLPSTRARLAKQRQQGFDKLFDDTQALLEVKKDAVTPWAQHLMASQAELQSRLEHLHDDHISSSKLSGIRTNVTANANLGAKSSLDKLFADTEAILYANKKDAPSPWAKQLMETQSEMQSRLEHLHDGQKQRSKLRGSRAVVKANVTVVNDAKNMLQLQWLPVKSWKETAPRRDSSANNTNDMKAVTVAREQLRHAEWYGKVPSVSCILALPTNVSMQFHFKYAINNFKLQNYDGDLELIVVYHHGDGAAAQLVRTYAEEGRIRGVASRALGEFPSTMALRYGAWTSKADVIAEWDFEAWHHPDRLSMQVRAMAMSGRPGSLVLNPEPAKERMQVNVMQGSLVGDAAWMREHWHPLLDEERGFLETYQSHNMVLVDAPALTINHHRTPAMNTSSSVSAVGGHDVLESLGVDTCRSILVEGAAEDRIGDEMTIRPQADGPLSDAIRNVFDKLKSLCKEAEEKVDYKERSFMHHHAGTMEQVRRQLIEHST